VTSEGEEESRQLTTPKPAMRQVETDEDYRLMTVEGGVEDEWDGQTVLAGMKGIEGRKKKEIRPDGVVVIVTLEVGWCSGCGVMTRLRWLMDGWMDGWDGWDGDGDDGDVDSVWRPPFVV
jgi:hypothetical protein